MRTLVSSGLAAALVVTVAGAPAGTASAQERDRLLPRDLMMLMQGGGSELGVSVRDLSADEITKAKLDRPGGVLVQNVRADSPAAQGGLKDGDIVVEFDGERVRSASHFTRLVRESAAGRTVKCSVVRDGARLTLDLTPGGDERRTMVLPPDLPRNFQFNLPRNLDPVPPLRRSPRGQIGVLLSPLGDQLASYFGVKEGVLVSSVTSGSAAAQAGLHAGDVITAVNERPVQNIGDATSAIRDARPGSALSMRVVRDRQELTITVTVPQLIDEPQSALPI